MGDVIDLPRTAGSPSPGEYPAPPDQGPRIDIVPTPNGVEVRVEGAGTAPSLYTSPQQMHQLLYGLQHAWEQFTLGQV